VSWPTTKVAFLGVLCGVSLGIAAGRWVWSAFATNLGVGAEAVVTAWVIAALVGGTLVVAHRVMPPPRWIRCRAS
jgi:hypothetical protein